MKSVASSFRLYAREDRHNVVHIAGLHDVKVESIGSVLEVCSFHLKCPHSSDRHMMNLLFLKHNHGIAMI